MLDIIIHININDISLAGFTFILTISLTFNNKKNKKKKK